TPLQSPDTLLRWLDLPCKYGLPVGHRRPAFQRFVVSGLPVRKIRRHADEWVKKIARASSMASGESKLFSYPTVEDPCILVRQNNGDLVAYSEVCTHLSCAVVHNEKKTCSFAPAIRVISLGKASILTRKRFGLGPDYSGPRPDWN